MSFLRRLFGSGSDAGAEQPAEQPLKWAATGEGPFDVEQIPGDWQFQVTFDDVVAHDEEDRVAAFVDRLAAVSGVKQAAHEDREVILVKVRGLTQEQMQAAAERAWEEAAGLS